MGVPIAATSMNVATITNLVNRPPPGPPTIAWRRYVVEGTLNPIHSREYDLTPGNEKGLAATALNQAMQSNYFCYDPLDDRELVHVRNVDELIRDDPNRNDHPGNRPFEDPEVLPAADE